MTTGIPLAAAMLSHYINQHGRGTDNFNVFRGGDYQYGEGIGDIFRSIGRFLLPILSSAAGGFISSASQGLSEGKTLKEAARGAFKPAVGSAIDSTGSQIMQRIRGSGIRRRRRASRRQQPKRNKTIPATLAKLVYKGLGKRRRTRKRISKSIFSIGRGRKVSKKQRKPRRKSVRFLPSNF